MTCKSPSFFLSLVLSWRPTAVSVDPTQLAAVHPITTAAAAAAAALYFLGCFTCWSLDGDSNYDKGLYTYIGHW